MADCSEALQRIETDFDDFRKSVSKICAADDFEAADLRDAIMRVSRLRGRYLKEKNRQNLTKSELRALHNVFECNKVIEDLIKIRQIAEHTVKSGVTFELVMLDDGPHTFDCTTSARPFFAASTVMIKDVNGNLVRIDHLNYLNIAKERIAVAIQKAKQ